MVVLAGCGGGSSVPQVSGTTQGQKTGDAAVMADSPSDLASEITIAKTMGQTPVYVTVRAPHQSYSFPVYSQVLRTDHALIVRAYGALYVYRMSSVTLTYGDKATPIAANTLPNVAAPYYEQVAAGTSAPGTFVKGNTTAKASQCPDCIALLLNPTISQTVAAQWNAQTDPWQAHPTYTPWSSAQTIANRPDMNGCNPGPCGSCLSGGHQPLIASRGGVTRDAGGCSGMSGSGFSTSGYNPCPTKRSCVGLIPPTPGQGCDGSQLTLGSQWPVNTTSGSNEVVNILALQANNANGIPEINGWIYVLGNGSEYIQGNPSFKRRCPGNPGHLKPWVSWPKAEGKPYAQIAIHRGADRSDPQRT